MNALDERPAHVLGEVERLRRETRARLRPQWFALVVFGVLSLASTPVAVFGAGLTVGAYWAIAGSAGGLVVGRYYRKCWTSEGLEGSPVAYIVAGAVAFFGAWVASGLAGVLGAERVAAASPGLFVAAGYGGLAMVTRRRDVGLAAMGIVALTASLLMSGLAARGIAVTLALTIGGAFLLTGVLERFGSR